MVELDKVPVIVEAPAPDAPPLTPVVVTGADQLYVVPAGTMPLTPLVGDTRIATPLQVVVVIAVIVALGFNVSVNWNDAPAQPFDNGVTV